MSGPAGNSIYERDQDFAFVNPVAVVGENWAADVAFGNEVDAHVGLIFALRLAYVSPELAPYLAAMRGQPIPVDDALKAHVRYLDVQYVERL